MPAAVSSPAAIIKMKESMELDELRQKNLELQQQIRQRNGIIRAMEMFLSPRQIQTFERRTIRNDDNDVEWDDDEMAKAVTLHAAGPDTYQLLLQQKYPLPTLAAIDRWLRQRQANSSTTNEQSSAGLAIQMDDNFNIRTNEW